MSRQSNRLRACEPNPKELQKQILIGALKHNANTIMAILVDTQ
jgi:hypothetical protein